MNYSINPQIITLLAFLILFINFIIFIFYKQHNKIDFFFKIITYSALALTSITFIGFTLCQTYRTLIITDYFFLISGIVLLIFTVLLSLKKIKISNNLHLFISVFLYFYFLSEIIVNIAVKKGYLNNMITISDGSLGTFNKQCLSPDLIKGYRWIDEDIRMLKIVNGNSVYDRIFRPNNAGYVSGKDYNFKKEDNIYRFIVLGDSYTAAEYIDSPWPDKIEMTINKPDDSLKYEFYSFALDAAGITNWHSIFFNEIVLQYEFDALILAVYDDDLYRNF